MTELHKKQGIALKLLDEFKSWNGIPDSLNDLNVHDRVLFLALTRDILAGPEDDVDQLIENLEKQNHNSLMKKLGTNMVS
jgi:hypothetical protein